VIQNIGLHRRAQRHHFVRVQLRVWLVVKEFLHRAPNERRPRCAAHQNDFVHLAGLQLRVCQRLLHRIHGAIHDRSDQCLKGATRKFVHERFSVRQREK